MNGDLHQAPPLSVCDDCSSGDRLFLHNVSRTPKSPPQKLCTSCVLQHYHKSFCAECFELYDASSLSAPPPSTATTTGANRLLMCIRCDNWSHVSCPKANTPKSPYLCPLCSPGNFKYFDYRKPSKESSNGGNQSLGKDDAKRLYAAARISAITMNKAVATARSEAERRVKEAALAKKRAKEAIDHVFVVSAKVGAKRKETAATAAAAAVAAVAAVTNGSPAVRNVNYAPVRLERNGGESEVNNGVDNGNVNGNGAVVKVPVLVAAITPHQQSNNGGGSSSNGKNGGNVGQPQSK